MAIWSICCLSQQKVKNGSHWTNLFFGIDITLQCCRLSGVTPRFFDTCIRKPHTTHNYLDLPRQRARVRNVNFSIILYVGKLTLDTNSGVKKKNAHYYRICGFLQGNTPNRLQVLSRRSGFFLKRKKNNNKKTSIIVCFVAFTFFLGSDNFATMYLLHL